ncbi:EAL domain-containing protein [uncultured Jatrophihabitans sp.]|uniref:EAL domain-containing protein n=1 Tax=uncultured Jatrophihabitans sp. TaxID=1610747 RepID=UPI0035CBA99E
MASPVLDDVVPALDTTSSTFTVTYQPILHVAWGTAAGYQAVTHSDGKSEIGTADGDQDAARADLRAAGVAATARAALAAIPTLPTNTFISIPVPLALLADHRIHAALTDYTTLDGVVLDIAEFSIGPLEAVTPALEAYRAAGALVAVGGRGAAQPELTSIVRLKPAIIRLGRAWVRGADRSEAKRSAIEVTGRLAAQLDACILAEGVTTSAELRALAGLDVPLAQGSFIGEAQQFWPDIKRTARTALPTNVAPTDGVLHALVQQSYTTTNLQAAQSVLPETTGFDVLVVLDEQRRPTALLEQGSTGQWVTSPVLAVHIDTPVADAVKQAMARPREVRFTPLACTDDAGRFLGVLRIERLMSHLSAGEPNT